LRGSRLLAPGSIMRIVPAGISTPPMLVVWLASRKWLFTGLSQCFFEEAGNEGAVVANRLLDVGSLTHHPHAGAEQLRRGLHTRGEEERRKLHDLLHIWRRTVRYVAAASSVSTSARGSRRRSLMYPRNLSSNHCSGLCATVSSAPISPTTSLPSTLRNSVWSSSHQGSSRALPSSAR
jgi:hypothetical protein